MASEKVLQSLEILHRELDKLSPAIEHVHTAQKIAETVKDIPQKHLELIKSVKQTDEDFKKDLKDQLKSEASKITVEVNQIIQKFKDTQDLLKGEIVDLEKLKKTIKDFHVEIVRINFPERLDKMDANISGIMAAVQAVQSRLDILERNITDRLKDSTDFQKEMKTAIQASLEQNKATQEAIAKKQQTNTYITWGLIVLAAIAIILIRK
jgi:chromosome segregation ATPase